MKMLTAFVLFVSAAVVGCSTFKEIGRSAENSNAQSERATGERKTSTDGTEPDIAANSGEFAPTDDPTADIERLGGRFLAQKTFRSVMDTTGNMQVHTELEFQAPDRFRLKNRLESGKSMEMILIGKQVYMNANGRWMKAPVAFGGTTALEMRDMFNREKLKWFQGLKYSGEERVEGKDAYVYVYTGKVEGMSESDSKIWVGKSDGMPIKIASTYKTGDMKTMDIVYDYDTPVSIEAPIK